MSPKASVVIPTRDRVDELRNLLESLRSQTVPLEVLVMDDGTNDETARMVSQEFPEVRYFHLASDRGPAYQRNRGIELASCSVAFPVDDDTLFVSTRTVEQTLAEFDADAIGAVAMPYINVRQDALVRQRAAGAGAFSVTFAYVGAAHAVRRDVFLKLGGYREAFFYMGEESDFCIRLYDAGYVVRLGAADPIHHLESPRRSFERADYHVSRNQVMFVWHNVPMPYLVPHILATTLNVVLHSFNPRRLWRRSRAIANAYGAILFGGAPRSPVRSLTYRVFRFLSRRQGAPIEEYRRFMDAG